ncbi:MAG: 6-carboxytetrahydropterin synthase [Bacteroidales bacterium]|nr:6-carboxytetrahydropterin synthase [Bacteroidales bacterium]
MKIRKLFKFEAAHIVRDCSTVRCRQNIHGHSFKVELVLQARGLDNAGMVMDFGLLKCRISSFFDAFDHSYIIWSADKGGLVDFIKNENERWVELPFSPSAENLALFFHVVVQGILNNTVPVNGADDVKVHSVRVHETETGWAETEADDIALLEGMAAAAIGSVFSDGIMDDSGNWAETWACLRENPDCLSAPQEHRLFRYAEIAEQAV